MTIYFYGIVEFGYFVIGGDKNPLAIIRRVDEVKEFDDPQAAWDFFVLGGFDSYVGANAVDENNDTYELVFKTREV